jgi:hypothetical protein
MQEIPITLKIKYREMIACGVVINGYNLNALQIEDRMFNWVWNIKEIGYQHKDEKEARASLIIVSADSKSITLVINKSSNERSDEINGVVIALEYRRSNEGFPPKENYDNQLAPWFDRTPRK